MTVLSKLKEKLKIIPNSPGCYLMHNNKNEIIYIGKAKNLSNRVKSYFTGAHNIKTTKLVSEIADFSYFQTKNELEALILELNLIKQHLPKYNIKLTDDATYPYIVITNEEHPRITISRDLKKDKGLYFGPYPNVYSARETVKIINKMFPLRKCETLPSKACLYYHMNECLAPCINKEEIDYKSIIKEITDFLKGDTKKVITTLQQRMEEAADKLQYERALEYKKMIDSIVVTTEKQLISLNDFKNRDFIAFKASDEKVSIQTLIMRSGKIVDTKNILIDRLIDPNDQVISYLLQYYEKNVIPDELYFSNEFNEAELKEIFKNKVFIPKIGDKKKLIDLAEENASYELVHYERLRKNIEKNHQEKEEIFKELLDLNKINHIEIFDNAHLFGASPISVLVVYKSGKPVKSEYRKFNLKSTNKADDYGAFKEVLYRRYQKVLLEDLTRPDLILVDGGKGQLSASKSIIDSLNLTIPIAAIKKNKKHQLESIIYNNKEYQLKVGTPLYLYLAEISEEVHRFAITFHKSKRRKKAYESHLDNIKGLGEVRKQKLLKTFVSIDNMLIGTTEEYKAIGITEELRKIIINTLEERVKDEKKS